MAVLVAAGALWYFMAGPGKQAPYRRHATTPPQTKQEAPKPAAAPVPQATAQPEAKAQPKAKPAESGPQNHRPAGFQPRLVLYRQGQDPLASPAVSDINGDGVLDVVAGSMDSNIYAIDGKTGRLHWMWRSDGPVISSPLTLDLTGDGVSDIIIGSDDGRAYALNGTGNKIWSAPEDGPKGAGNEFQSSPAAADLSTATKSPTS